MAFSGAIALMVYIKAYGSMFSGPQLSNKSGAYHEPPGLTIFSFFLLALGCVILGIGAPWISPIIAQVAAMATNSPALSVSQGQAIFPGTSSQAVLSPALVAVLLVSLLAVPFILVLIMGGYKAGKRANVEPWSCGYGYSARMSITAASFYQPVKVNFHPIYWLRSITDRPFDAIRILSISFKAQILRAEPIHRNDSDETNGSVDRNRWAMDTDSTNGRYPRLLPIYHRHSGYFTDRNIREEWVMTQTGLWIGVGIFQTILLLLLAPLFSGFSRVMRAKIS